MHENQRIGAAALARRFGLCEQDNCVHVWDVGKASTTRTVFGPHICGNALDVAGDMIVTGSWRDDCQVKTTSKSRASILRCLYSAVLLQ